MNGQSTTFISNFIFMLAISYSEAYELEEDNMPEVDASYYTEQCDKLKAELEHLKRKYEAAVFTLADMDICNHFNGSDDGNRLSLYRMMKAVANGSGHELFQDVLKSIDIHSPYFKDLIYMNNKQTCDIIFGNCCGTSCATEKDVMKFVHLFDVSLLNEYTDDKQDPIWVRILNDLEDINDMKEFFKLGINIEGLNHEGENIFEYVLDDTHRFFFCTRAEILEMLFEVYDMKKLFDIGHDFVEKLSELKGEDEEFVDVINFLRRQ